MLQIILTQNSTMNFEDLVSYFTELSVSMMVTIQVQHICAHLQYEQWNMHTNLIWFALLVVFIFSQICVIYVALFFRIV